MKFVGVTSCVAGLVHTYMAAQGLKKECKKRGISIKVETQGQMGIEDHLSQKEIDEADVVIFACDLTVREAERFEGKPCVVTRSKEAINKPEQIITEAIAKASKEPHM
jgi:fructose-specific phosphotransferase system IIB component